MTLIKDILLFSSGGKANFEEKIKQDQQIGTQFLKKDPYRILVPKIGTHFVRVLFGWITIAMCFLSTLFTGVLLFLLVISYSSSM